MSDESLLSHALITSAAVGLEDALARMLASVRLDVERAIGAIESERRAAMATLLIVQEQLRTAQKEYAELIERIKQQRIELRGEKGETGHQGEPGLEGVSGAPGAAGRDGRDGLPGVPGERGRDGANGVDGKDGLGVADFKVDHDGR